MVTPGTVAAGATLAGADPWLAELVTFRAASTSDGGGSTTDGGSMPDGSDEDGGGESTQGGPDESTTLRLDPALGCGTAPGAFEGDAIIALFVMFREPRRSRRDRAALQPPPRRVRELPRAARGEAV